MTDLAGEAADLLQHLIRNSCVNDGTADSGQETRSADTLRAYLEGAGLDLERYEPHPGRESLVARIEGSDPGAPSLMLMGHTDVVPANPDRWRRDPFGGELVDGEVWGRGAVDMLNLTSTMAVAFRRLADEGFSPRGDLVYLAVADEEALGTHGAAWLLEHQADAVRTDYLVTEFGGARLPIPTRGGPKIPVTVAEKGSHWCTLRVRGTPGHASMPLRTDNAVVKAAEVVRRLGEHAPASRIHDTWRAFVDRMEFEPDLARALLDPSRVREVAEGYPDVGVARVVHACTHMTVAPTVVSGGVKTNVIPDTVELQLDIRTLPGQSPDEVRGWLREAVGEDLWPEVELTEDAVEPASDSPVDTPLWDSLERVTGALLPGTATVPYMISGATDSRFFRRAGVTSYGFGLYSDRVGFADFMSMFHGDDERVDTESLRLSTELWMALARDLLV